METIASKYMERIAKEMRLKSESIRRDFATHHLSAGANREELVKNFLEGHLPKRFGVSTGLILSHDGEFSKQADLVVVDDQNNAPLYPDGSSKIWPVESVYALIEVKTNLNPRDLEDAVDKGRRFKRLPRKFYDTGMPRRIEDSLFVIWAFEASNTLKSNLFQMFDQVPTAEQPDFIIVPDRMFAQSGRWLELTTFGQNNSPYRRNLKSRHSNDLSSSSKDSQTIIEGLDSKDSLIAWYVRFASWLHQVGPRAYSLSDYIPPTLRGKD